MDSKGFGDVLSNEPKSLIDLAYEAMRDKFHDVHYHNNLSIIDSVRRLAEALRSDEDQVHIMIMSWLFRLDAGVVDDVLSAALQFLDEFATHTFASLVIRRADQIKLEREQQQDATTAGIHSVQIQLLTNEIDRLVLHAVAVTECERVTHIYRSVDIYASSYVDKGISVSYAAEKLRKEFSSRKETQDD